MFIIVIVGWKGYMHSVMQLILHTLDCIWVREKVCVFTFVFEAYLGHNVFVKQNIPKMTFVSSY